MQKLIIILGPTAIGKSSLGIEIAQEFNGEIISADSVQIYKNLNIGSGKVMPDEMQGVVHHCIDILEPNQEFSVFEFVQLTKQKIKEIADKGKMPIIVGGTGLYVKSLLENYDFGGSQKQKEFREVAQKMVDENAEACLLKVKHKLPEFAKNIDINNKKRLIRALEILKFGEQPTKSNSDFDTFIVNLDLERAKLYERINYRTKQMFENGLVQEIKGLIEQGLDENNQSMRAIGYKEVIPFVKGEYDLKTTIDLVCQHARNYAKRQITFFKSLQDRKVFDIEKNDFKKDLIVRIKEWL